MLRVRKRIGSATTAAILGLPDHGIAGPQNSQMSSSMTKDASHVPGFNTTLGRPVFVFESGVAASSGPYPKKLKSDLPVVTRDGVPRERHVSDISSTGRVPSHGLQRPVETSAGRPNAHGSPKASRGFAPGHPVINPTRSAAADNRDGCLSSDRQKIRRCSAPIGPMITRVIDIPVFAPPPSLSQTLSSIRMKQHHPRNSDVQKDVPPRRRTTSGVPWDEI
jgi:hypothetical protein